MSCFYLSSQNERGGERRHDLWLHWYCSAELEPKRHLQTPSYPNKATPSIFSSSLHAWRLLLRIVASLSIPFRRSCPLVTVLTSRPSSPAMLCQSICEETSHCHWSPTSIHRYSTKIPSPLTLVGASLDSRATSYTLSCYNVWTCLESIWLTQPIHPPHG